jgi:hypothetical protein
VDWSQPNTIEFSELEFNGVLFVVMEGQVYCNRGVVLEVEKLFETRQTGRGKRRSVQVRGLSYRYAAWIRDGYPVLRYHNVHEDQDQYHHRVFDPLTGEEVFYEQLTRVQFPTFTEVLDEIEQVTRTLEQAAGE